MDNFDEMIEQLIDIMQDKERYIDDDDPNDIIAKDVKNLHCAIDILKNYRQNMDNFRYEKLLLSNKIEQKDDEIYLYKNIIDDYRKIIDLIINDINKGEGNEK